MFHNMISACQPIYGFAEALSNFNNNNAFWLETKRVVGKGLDGPMLWAIFLTHRKFPKYLCLKMSRFI